MPTCCCWIGTSVGISQFLGGLQMHSFGAEVALLLIFVLSIGTARVRWAQLERLMRQLEAANFKAIDINNSNEFV